MKRKFGATAENTHVDALLSNVAINYRPEGMIADLIFPMVPVAKQSDFYSIFLRSDALRVEESLRAPGTEANEITREVSTAAYFAKNYALKYGVTIEDRANADPIFVQQLLNGRVEYIMDKLMLGWETRIASQVTSTTNVGSSAAVASAWSDLTNADPLGDVQAGMDNIQDSTGKRVKRIVFGDLAWRNFRRNTAIRNLIFGVDNGGGYPNVAQVKALLEVDDILIGGAYQNTANEAQAEVLAQVWGDNVLLFHTPASPSTEQPAFGYSFRWSAAGLPNLQAERHPYDSRKKREEVEVGYYQGEEIVGADYGFLIADTQSST